MSDNLQRIRVQCTSCRSFNIFSVPASKLVQSVYLQCGNCSKRVVPLFPKNHPLPEAEDVDPQGSGDLAKQKSNPSVGNGQSRPGESGRSGDLNRPSSVSDRNCDQKSTPRPEQQNTNEPPARIQDLQSQASSSIPEKTTTNHMNQNPPMDTSDDFVHGSNRDNHHQQNRSQDEINIHNQKACDPKQRDQDVQNPKPHNSTPNSQITIPQTINPQNQILNLQNQILNPQNPNLQNPNPQNPYSNPQNPYLNLQNTNRNPQIPSLLNALSELQPPIPNRKRPTQNHQPPSQNHQPATQNHQPPTQNHQPPTQNHQPPTQNHQPPTRHYQPPTQNHQPPTQNHQPPSQNHQPPTQQHQPPEMLDLTLSDDLIEQPQTPSRPSLECKLCQRIFKYPRSLEKHKQSHPPLKSPKPFSCSLCKSRFKNFNGLKTHVARTHNVFICTSCKKLEKTQCRICRKSFRLQKSAKNCLKAHPNQTVKCGICRIKYTHTTSRIQNLPRGVELFACTVCQRTFRLPGSLKTHLRKHIDEPNSREATYSGQKLFKCNICRKKFVFSEVLRKHVSKHAKTDATSGKGKCDVCLKSFRSSSLFEIHIPKCVGKHPYKCNACRQSFARLNALKSHSATHVEGLYGCPICRKAYKHLDNLKRHAIAHGDKVFQCKKCKRSFAREAGLEKHDCKTYKCDICDKKFAQLGNFKRHENLHSRGVAFECTVCDKIFVTPEDLNAHGNSHSGKQQFECKICRKTFRFMSTLRTHEAKHASKNKHKCVFCDKTFPKAHNLKAHRMTHSGEYLSLYNMGGRGNTKKRKRR